MANFTYGMQRENSVGQDSEARQYMDQASNLMMTLIRDFCARSYREHYDRIGWLWSASRSDSPIEAAYREAMPLVQALVYIAILLTKEESI